MAIGTPGERFTTEDPSPKYETVVTTPEQSTEAEERIRNSMATAAKAVKKGDIESRDSQEQAARLLAQALDSGTTNNPPNGNVTVDQSINRQIQQANNLVNVASPEISKTTNDLLKTVLDTLKNFLKKFGLLNDTGKIDKEKLDNLISKFIDSRRDNEALSEKGAIFAEGKDNRLEITFPKGAEITGINKPASIAPSTTSAEKQIDTRDGKIVLVKDSQVTKVETNTGGILIMTVTNKDGSTDTYTIKGAERKEASQTNQVNTSNSTAPSAK